MRGSMSSRGQTIRRPSMTAALAIAASLVIGIGAGVLWQR